MSGYKTHRLSQEPDDFDGPWPEENTMKKPTADEVMQLANEYAHCYSFVGDDTMPRKHKELRAAIEVLAAPNHTNRWNIDEMSDGSLSVCKGEHAGSDPCEPVLYVPAPVAAAPASREEMATFAAELKADPAKAQRFFQGAGILDASGNLTPQYGGQAQGEPVEIVPRVWREALRKLTFMARTSGGSAVPDKELQAACAQAEALLSKPYNYPPAAPQQAEPVAQIGWADEFGNLFPMGAWKPTQRTHHDSHKTGWRPVFLHPPRADAEVARLKLQSAAADLVHRETATTALMQMAEIARLRAALEEVRLLSSRYYKEAWAKHMLRFCESAGVVGSPLRGE